MKIIRYSKKGFKPQYQSYHLDIDVYYHLKNFNEYISDYPEHLKLFCIKQHEKLLPFYQQHINELQYGVWAFINGYKNNQSLNHLRERVPCWEADISDNTIVFDVNWEYVMPITDMKCEMFGFYIPKQQLNTLHNVKKR